MNAGHRLHGAMGLPEFFGPAALGMESVHAAPPVPIIETERMGSADLREVRRDLTVMGIALTQRDFTGEGDGDRNGHGTPCAATVFGRELKGTRNGVACGLDDALNGKVLGEGGRDGSQIMGGRLIEDGLSDGF